MKVSARRRNPSPTVLRRLQCCDEGPTDIAEKMFCKTSGRYTRIWFLLKRTFISSRGLAVYCLHTFISSRGAWSGGVLQYPWPWNRSVAASILEPARAEGEECKPRESHARKQSAGQLPFVQPLARRARCVHNYVF